MLDTTFAIASGHKLFEGWQYSTYGAVVICVEVAHLSSDLVSTPQNLTPARPVC